MKIKNKWIGEIGVKLKLLSKICHHYHDIYFVYTMDTKQPIDISLWIEYTIGSYRLDSNKRFGMLTTPKYTETFYIPKNNIAVENNNFFEKPGGYPKYLKFVYFSNIVEEIDGVMRNNLQDVVIIGMCN
jgi:hypothetical protein